MGKKTEWSLSDPEHIFIDESKREIINRAISGGASKAVMGHRPFKLTNNVIDIEVHNKRGTRIFNKAEQVEAYKTLWDEPYGAPYVFCISSAPTEVMASMVALRMFLRATVLGERDDDMHGRPYWHNVMGGVSHDLLRDEARRGDISYLILSNVPANATPYKIEKLRDILSKYSNIPRIVVTSDEDPIEFMTTALKMQVNYCLYLGVKKEQRW